MSDTITVMASAFDLLAVCTANVCSQIECSLHEQTMTVLRLGDNGRALAKIAIDLQLSSPMTISKVGRCFEISGT